MVTENEAGKNQDSSPSPGDTKRVVPDLDSALREWYFERDRQSNIENGKPYFNGPAEVPPPERHSPSRLLKCHRRVYYSLHNAPAETREPAGMFWFGSQFEHEVAVPFLKSRTRDTEYIRNSVWVDHEVEWKGTALQFRGETDPVIVDEASSPQLLTEIKTTGSFASLDVPKPQHLAQVHAYLAGLSLDGSRFVHDAVLVYAKRDDFSIRTFAISFDSSFWEDQVLEWAKRNTRYRMVGNLPPAVPEFEWECEYCPYRRRCGQSEQNPHSDSGVVGLLPLVSDYPRRRVEEYLTAHKGARLTPTLATQYPALDREYGSYDWWCEACGKREETVSWSGDTEDPPACRDCGSDGIYSPLAGPAPEKQRELIGEADA